MAAKSVLFHSFQKRNVPTFFSIAKRCYSFNFFYRYIFNLNSGLIYSRDIHLEVVKAICTYYTAGNNALAQ